MKIGHSTRNEKLKILIKFKHYMLCARAIKQVYAKVNTLNIPEGDIQSVMDLSNKYSLTQYDFEDLILEIIGNHTFFRQRLWNSAYTLSNVVHFAFDAKFTNPRTYTGTNLRNKVTIDYKRLLDKKSSEV